MTRLLLRHLLLLCLAFIVSWWVVFHDPPEVVPHRLQPPGEIRVALEALASKASESAPQPAAQEAAQEEQPTPGEEAAPSPPPPELGSPTAEEEDRPLAASSLEQSADPEVSEDQGQAESSPADSEPAKLMADPKLLAAAALEVEGLGRKGFSTQLIAAPEDQLEIARAFGEELVLIPYRSVAPEAPDRSWYRIAREGEPTVERVSTPPPLSNYRQYRDLFDYEYSQLPDSLRELRRAVLSRNEVYLFAALIPAREWALVIGRRRQALELSGRSIDDVRTFRIRYHKATGTGIDVGFDVEVIEILFADGTRYHPAGAPKTLR